MTRQDTIGDTGTSVVVGTFNGARHIEEQLASIVDQTIPPTEIVVSDDGSSDDTVTIVQRFAASCAVPVRLFRNDRQLGFADNFLRAAEQSVGRFIAFSDQDDRWSPSKLERSVEALTAHHAVYCSHAVELMDEHGVDLGRRAQGAPKDAVVEPRTADPWGARYGFSVTIERRLLDAVPAGARGPDTFGERPVLSHDRWAYALAWGLGRSVHLAEPLARYRQHSSQLFGGPSSRSIATRVQQKAAEGPDRLRFLAEVAELRSRLMAGAVWHDDTAPATTAWKRLASLYAARADLYEEPRGLLRARRLARLVGAGAYREVPDRGVGRKRLIEDVGFGLPGPAARRTLSGVQKNRL